MKPAPTRTGPQHKTIWIEQGQPAPWSGFLVDKERLRILIEQAETLKEIEGKL